MKMKIALNAAYLFMLFSGLLFAEAGKITLKNSGKPVAVYNSEFIPSPDKEAPWYGRSGFIHPVYTPNGVVVTEAFPKDHMHHHAIMFAWTTAMIDGERVDFWNSHRKQAKIEHVETLEVDDDEFEVRLRHINLTTKEPDPMLDEVWEVEAFDFEGVNAFSLESTQTCIKDEPFKIAKYHYGAMCVRGSDQFYKDFDVLTSEGKDRDAANHSRPVWVAMSGVVDGKRCGIAAMSHPDNFRAPQPVRVHPKMPYFCFAPMILDDFEIKPDEPYVSKFLIVAYDGDVNAELLDKVYAAYLKAEWF